MVFSMATPKILSEAMVDYARESFKHSKTILGGSVVLTALGFIADVDQGVRIPPWVFWALAVVGLCVAQFRAYRGIHERHRILKASIDSQSERTRMLRENEVIENQTFHVWELLADPGATKAVIHTRKFRNCHILGPTVVTIIGPTVFNNCSFEESSPEDVYIPLTDKLSVVGVTAFVGCEFDRCQFQHMAFLGDEELLKKFKEWIVL